MLSKLYKNEAIEMNVITYVRTNTDCCQKLSQIFQKTFFQII